MERATIYRRRNGQYGSSCDGIGDTGHDIKMVRGRFKVWGHDGYSPYLICKAGTREEAEQAIADDWRSPLNPPL